jgi:hypothetical protein
VPSALLLYEERMKKKLLIGLGAFALVVVAALAYLNLVVNKRSPIDTVTVSAGGVDAKVVYCRPYKKGRVIFGEESAGALVPFNKYWRLGANAATELHLAKNVLFAGKPVTAGTYRMYAVPGPTTWKVVLNSELGWGYSEPDYSKDVLSVEVPAETASAPLEQFTISMAGEGSGARMDFAWDSAVVHVPIAPN